MHRSGLGRRHADGDVIFRQGEAGYELYVILVLADVVCRRGTCGADLMRGHPRIDEGGRRA